MIEDATNGGPKTENRGRPEDAELLRRYADEKSEAAFAELVRRHLNLVYSVALRQVAGDAHLAEDVTQQVFTALARKAGVLAQRPALSGWLYRSTHFAASDVVRAERRRRTREQEAHTMDSIINSPPAMADWDKLRPVLDDAIAELPEPDRDAVSLRFLEGRSFAEVGTKLRLSENAARMRVERALDKLHAALSRRGVTSTAAALGVALANQAAVAAPAGLAASVTGAALAGTAVGVGGWAATFMSISKIQIGITSALAVAGATAYGLQGKTNAALRQEIVALQSQQQAVVALRTENRQLAGVAAEVELLRQDDTELKQLAQRATEIKAANVENARLAQVSTKNRANALSAQIRDQDLLAQAEVDRMNREGNKLVDEYKALIARAKDGALTADERAQVDAASKTKFTEIQAKQKEVQAFIEATRLALGAQVAELQRLDPSGTLSTVPTNSRWSAGGSAGTLKLGPSPSSGGELTFKPGDPSAAPIIKAK